MIKRLMLSSLFLGIASAQASAGGYTIQEYGASSQLDKAHLESPSLGSTNSSAATEQKNTPLANLQASLDYKPQSVQVSSGGSYDQSTDSDEPMVIRANKAKVTVIKDDRSNWMTSTGKKNAEFFADVEKTIASNRKSGMAYARIYSQGGPEVKYVGPASNYFNLSGANVSASRSADRNAYDTIIASMSQKYGVSKGLIKAVMHTESSFNRNAKSHAGAQGLMQLMPATARRFNVSNSYDPAQNIEGGVKYLSWLIKRFNGDLSLALAGYNAGEGAVDRHKGIPPYKETQNYVKQVLSRYHTLYKNI